MCNGRPWNPKLSERTCVCILAVGKWLKSYVRSHVQALSLDPAKTVVHAFISSRFDYCNSLASPTTYSGLYKLCKTLLHACLPVPVGVTTYLQFYRLTPWLECTMYPPHLLAMSILIIGRFLLTVVFRFINFLFSRKFTESRTELCVVEFNCISYMKISDAFSLLWTSSNSKRGGHHVSCWVS